MLLYLNIKISRKSTLTNTEINKTMNGRKNVKLTKEKTLQMFEHNEGCQII